MIEKHKVIKKDHSIRKLTKLYAPHRRRKGKAGQLVKNKRKAIDIGHKILHNPFVLSKKKRANSGIEELQGIHPTTN
jgi:hypothetical protein